MIARIRNRAGFTLVEIIAALALFGLVGLALSGTVNLASRAQGTVSDSSARNSALQAASVQLREDLRSAAAAGLTITDLTDGNQEITFQVPVEVAGVQGFGAFEPRLGNSEAEQNQPGWFIRYTVAENPNGSRRRLVRQVLDAASQVQRQRVLTRGLPADSTGFRLDPAGDMWRVSLTLASQDGSRNWTEELDVRTRN